MWNNYIDQLQVPQSVSYLSKVLNTASNWTVIAELLGIKSLYDTYTKHFDHDLNTTSGKLL